MSRTNPSQAASGIIQGRHGMCRPFGRPSMNHRTAGSAASRPSIIQPGRCRTTVESYSFAAFA